MFKGLLLRIPRGMCVFFMVCVFFVMFFLIAPLIVAGGVRLHVDALLLVQADETAVCPLSQHASYLLGRCALAYIASHVACLFACESVW